MGVRSSFDPVGASSRSPLRGVALGLAAVGVVAVLAVGAPSLAYWVSSEETDGLTVTAGHAALEVVAPTLQGGDVAGIYPGGVVFYDGGVVENTGHVPLDVTFSPEFSANTDDFSFLYGVEDDGTCVADRSPSQTMMLLAGASASFCVSVTGALDINTEPGETVTLTLTLDGTDE